MKLKHNFSSFFLKFVPRLSIFFFSISFSVLAQTGKIELRSIDNSENKISAGLQFFDTQNSVVDAIHAKFSESKIFVANKEFIVEKSNGYISIKSSGPATLKDFEALLISAGIEKINYSGELISVFELQAKYKPLNKFEVRPRPNR